MLIDVRLDTVEYPYRVDSDWLPGIADRLVDMAATSYVILGDTNTGPLYGRPLAELLSSRATVHTLVHPAGERGKHAETVFGLMESALRLGIDRSAVVVAVGGGVTGNIGGLMAALLFRGIRLVHVPTSLVAMLDSVLSLKQAVNAGVGKNLIGTFYPPTEVMADTTMLRTLPRREIVSGLCEAVKNSLAIRPAMAELMLDALPLGGAHDDEAMQAIIVASIEAKAEVTREDMRECRAGLVLEYGHTVGHALEHATCGGLSHGEAVGLGMLAAASLSHRMGHLDAATVALHRVLLERAGARTRIPSGIDLAAVMDRVGFDNKRGYLSMGPDSAALVLLRAHGEPIVADGRPLVPVPMDMVRDAVDELSVLGTPSDRGARPVREFAAGAGV